MGRVVRVAQHFLRRSCVCHEERSPRTAMRTFADVQRSTQPLPRR
jgi:hypothetical protein